MAIDNPSSANSQSGDGKRTPVVWTPEDAANFLGAAIKEAQRPLLKMIEKQGVPKWVFALVALIFLALAGVFYHHARREFDHLRDLNMQMQAERDDAARAASDSRDLLHKTEISLIESKGKQEILEKEVLELAAEKAELAETHSKLAGQYANLQSAYQEEVERGMNSQDKLRDDDTQRQEEVRRLKDELHDAHMALEAREKRTSEERQAAEKTQRQIKLLQVQLEGMEEEKNAMAKQLNAARELLKETRDPAAGEKTKPEPLAPAEKPGGEEPAPKRGETDMTL